MNDIDFVVFCIIYVICLVGGLVVSLIKEGDL